MLKSFVSVETNLIFVAQSSPSACAMGVVFSKVFGSQELDSYPLRERLRDLRNFIGTSWDPWGVYTINLGLCLQNFTDMNRCSTKNWREIPKWRLKFQAGELF